RDLGLVLRLGGLMLLVTLLGAGAAVGRNFLSSMVSQRFGTRLRSDMYRRIHALGFQELDRLDTASLVTRLTNDVSQVQNFVNGMMRIFVKAPLLAIGGIVMALVLNARMSLVLLVVVPVVAGLIWLSIRLGYPFFRKIQACLDRVNGSMREYLAGVRVVKAFNRFAYEEARFAGTNDELSTSTTKAMRVMALFAPGIALAVNLGIVCVLWLGGWRVSGGTMKVGQVVAFINYMTQILVSLMMIGFIFNVFVRARASAERIGEVMAAEVPDADRPTGTVAPRGGDLAFQDVSFAYGSGGLVLREVTFGCREGTTLGILGATGSGKTTLVNLIPRFYEVGGGAITLGGADLRRLDVDDLRRRIALVPQKTVLFSGSILDNLRWGNERASMAEVEEAARTAQAHDFITGFAEGYATVLGRGGVNLSGGQKQRIAIARALLRDPEILILDDSLSAVDLVTEARIAKALREQRASRTTILIAQRIASVRDLETILVLDGGRSAGLGTHDALLSSCAVYQDIHRSQAGLGGDFDDRA
ncbi:MAG TPA: ABC transporter ATP-binding protein, partial [Holophaga sp.]|nr:ABC transporter ATP-binding protein [Holophaga sp.]